LGHSFDLGGTILSQNDPTDDALATIASILDQPESRREVDRSEPRLAPPAPGEADGYSKLGPGPIAALRFKWTARRGDNDQYFVDETIGENSSPIVSGPMTEEEAIQFVDDREHETRERFEELRQEMTGRAAAADLVRGTGEA
jgi:hypothetical protein